MSIEQNRTHTPLADDQRDHRETSETFDGDPRDRATAVTAPQSAASGGRPDARTTEAHTPDTHTEHEPKTHATDARISDERTIDGRTTEHEPRTHATDGQTTGEPKDGVFVVGRGADAATDTRREPTDDDAASADRHRTIAAVAPGTDPSSVGARTPDAGNDFGGKHEAGTERSSSEQRNRTDDLSVDPLFDDHTLEQLRTRWRELQGTFVDSPRDAVAGADDLVSELIHQLTATYAERKQTLAAHLSDDADTEALRNSLRYYRAFFNQLLSPAA